MAASNFASYVGRRVRITADYFKDVEEVSVEDDFVYDTKITKIINKTNRARMRFVFEDHEGEENQVDFDLLQSLLLEEDNDGEAPGVDEAKGN
jgi:hypothetical protein